MIKQINEQQNSCNLQTWRLKPYLDADETRFAHEIDPQKENRKGISLRLPATL